MASRKKGGKTGGRGPDKGGVRKLPAVDFEDFAEADRIFRESLEKLGDLPPEAWTDEGKAAAKGQARSQNKGNQGQASDKRAASGPRSGKSGRTETTVDLHGMTLREAKACLDAAIGEVLSASGALAGQVTLKIVTGKGLHSGPGGAVLPKEIHRYVRSAYGDFIVRIDESPADVVLGGVPLRGHFNVTFGRK